jgi:hypothetical protein
MSTSDASQTVLTPDADSATGVSLPLSGALPPGVPDPALLARMANEFFTALVRVRSTCRQLRCPLRPPADFPRRLPFPRPSRQLDPKRPFRPTSIFPGFPAASGRQPSRPYHFPFRQALRRYPARSLPPSPKLPRRLQRFLSFRTRGRSTATPTPRQDLILQPRL